MKIKKFRIYNYKSIVDSGDCYPSPSVTIFAGKNEAGKTSILEALEDFNLGQKIRDKAVPIVEEGNDERLIPKINITFEVNRRDIAEIFEENNHQFTKKIADSYEIWIEKSFPDNYAISPQVSKDFELDLKTLNAEVIAQGASLDAGIRSALQAFGITLASLPDFNSDGLEDYSAKLEKFSAELNPKLPQIPEAQRNQLLTQIAGMRDLCPKFYDSGFSSSDFLKVLLEYVPNFILFSSFDDVFPNKIPVTELEKNEWIRDLSVISNLDVKTVMSGSERQKKTHKHRINISLNDDYQKFWVQDVSKLEVDWEGQHLYFWIEENGLYYEPGDRSQGKRWHLSYYIRVTARARENVRNVILIDEPGLYLHAVAQQDILKSLEDASKEAPCFISTHSPYLIEPDKLDRLRLVLKSEDGNSVIENKIHKVADKETLRPILTAIGLELNQGIAHTDQINNVIVEGPSDYYYLNAFKLVQKKEGINFVFGGGAGNMPKVGTILQGWGCNVIYLYDSDQGYKAAINNIKEYWVTTTLEMVAKLSVPDAAIEDVLSVDDYIRHILSGEPKGAVQKNSEYAKSKKRDKVLDAKLFLERVRKDSVTLDATTKKNIRAVFDEIESKLKQFSK